MTDPRQENFMADLQALMNKHDAELEVGDDGGEYGMQQGACTISFRYDPYRPHFEFELPKYMRPELIKKLSRERDEYDPTPWCMGCGSMTQSGCNCGPIAKNN